MIKFSYFLLTVTLSGATAFYTHAQSVVGQVLNGEGDGDRFGAAISISETGTSVAIASPDNGRFGTGLSKVKVYGLDNGTWTQQGADFTDVFDVRLGQELSVDLDEDGNVLAIGNPTFNATVGNDAGRITTFNWNGTSWSSRAAAIEGSYSGANLGLDLRLTPGADQLTTGAFRGDPDAVRGAIPYLLSGSTYNSVVTTPLLVAFGDQVVNSIGFGRNGLRLAIGYQQNNANPKVEIQQFQTGTNAWVTAGTITGDEMNGGFGNEIATAVNGLTIGVGSPNANGGVGKVKVFDNMRAQIGGDIVGRATDGEFGHAISMSEQGNRIVIGAPNRDNPSAVGRAAVYELQGDTWVEIASFEGSVPGEEMGFAVDMTPDGNFVAIGRPRYQEAGSEDVGRVVVYDLRGSSSLRSISELSYVLGPNPTSGVLTLQDLPVEVTTAEIYNANGQFVVNTGVSAGQLDVSSLPSGSYTLRLRIDGILGSKSFIKL